MSQLYVSTVEARKYPILGVQWHPEVITWGILITCILWLCTFRCFVRRRLIQCMSSDFEITLPTGYGYLKIEVDVLRKARLNGAQTAFLTMQTPSSSCKVSPTTSLRTHSSSFSLLKRVNLICFRCDIRTLSQFHLPSFLYWRLHCSSILLSLRSGGLLQWGKEVISQTGFPEGGEGFFDLQLWPCLRSQRWVCIWPATFHD